MEIDDNEDLNIAAVSSNANVDTTSSVSTDERNAPRSSAIDCENEPSSSQLVSALANLHASGSLFSAEGNLNPLVQNFVDEYNQRRSNFTPMDNRFPSDTNEAIDEPASYVESEEAFSENERRVRSPTVERLMDDCETLRILNESPNFEEDEREVAGSSGSQLITERESARVLGAPSDLESENNRDTSQNRHHVNSAQESLSLTHNLDSQNGEPLDNTDQLFAPEDSSSSSDTSQTDLPSTSNLFSTLRQRSTLPASNPYFSFLNSQTRHNSSREDRTMFRYSPRYSRFSSTPPLNLSSDTNSVNVRDSHINFGPSRRISSYLLNRSRLWNLRYRTRSAYADWLMRHRSSAALSAVSSSDGNGNFMDKSDLRELQSRIPFRRNLCLPRTSNESNYCPISSSVYDSSGHLNSERPSSSARERTPLILRSIIDFENLSHASRTAERASSSVRARSVSPTSANPWFSASSIQDDSLDDTAVTFRSSYARSVERQFLNENRDTELPRPSTPLPPTLSDDDSPLTPNNFEDDLMTTVQSAPESAVAPGRSANIPTNVTAGDLKEVPHTYEELNSELIQLLECPICFEYSTPPINQCLQGHIICNNCRQRVNTCPTCRNVFQESRNLIVEKVAALLRYPCKNAVTGCLETLYLLQKEQHEKACGFRHYVCFIPMCNWRGYKPELLVHVQETHENHVIHGATVNLMIPITGQTKRVWLMSAFNELFCVIFFATLGILKGCVRFIGDPSKCDSFTYNISVTSDEEMLRNFNYTRTTHAYEETFENLDIIDSYDLFSISHAQLNLFRKGTKAPIRVTIEEAHMRQRSGLGVTASSNV